MSHQHYSDKVKKMKSKTKMGRNDRYTGKSWTDSRDEKFTAPTQGLKNVFLGRVNSFKKVLSDLSAHLGEFELSKL